MQQAQSRILPDGRRLHLHHGPIDIIMDVSGRGREEALFQAGCRFGTILEELVAELPALRAPVQPLQKFKGAVAHRMLAAVTPYSDVFITPMAAVAGAVADEVLETACAGGGVNSSYVNNGGDVALYLTDKAQLTGAFLGALPGRVTIHADSAVRGVATSGWRGRSHSLGIADAVTVLAGSAAAADAAATLIANAVDLPGHPSILRQPAHTLSPDSDLGDRLVTVGVGPLSDTDVAMALKRGCAYANACVARGLIVAAHLTLDGQSCTVGAPALVAEPGKVACHA